MSDFLFNFIGFILLGSVAVVLILGIYTLFKGGDTSKKYSNKLMQLRVLLQFIAVIVLVLLAYFFKN
jgi:heme/copper-type cytochrome/quinol oxidase subunit 2|tara:strand:+ start:14 stop:214 length:201 start_codon:yes stop_codon:yes gene_type:complete